jgi:hypothetical protein
MGPDPTWEALVAEQETQEPQAPEQETEQKPDTGQAPDLAKEVEKWKALARKHEDASKANSQAAKRLADIEAANATEQEKAVAAARQEASTETASKYSSRIISAEIRAAAGGKLADPSDAVRLLDMSTFSLDDNDEVDSAAVVKAIDELLKSKPYLGVKDDRRFQGGADQGARGGQKQTIDDQIREAEGKGDWRTAGALKAQKLSELPHS